MNNEQLTMTNGAATRPVGGNFDKVLGAWRDGKGTTWSELMTAWVEAPAAPRSSETIVKLIKHLGKG
jgi:hypothetical protein